MKSIIIISCFCFAGCFGPKYRAASSYYSEGFIDTRLSFDMFEIKFNGNALSSIKQSVDYCMLRCAEITLEKGFKFFEVAYSESGMYNYIVKNPDLYAEVAGNPIVLPGAYTPEPRIPVAENTIVCFKAMPTDLYDYSGRRRIFFNAEKVISKIKGEYKL